MVSYYLDCYALHRFLNNQDNTYNNLRDPLFSLVKRIRRKPLPELRLIFENSYDTLFPASISLSTVNYLSDTTSVLHLLARLAHFLEDGLLLTNKVGFPAYVQRKKSNSTFDIEHLLPADAGITKTELGSSYDFANDEEYKNVRNSLGALILLSRGRNRSLKARPFGEKRDAYATEGVLAQTFCDSFYANNPQVKEQINRLGLEIEAKALVNKSAIAEREKLYNKIAGMIWGKSNFASIEADAGVRT